LADRPSGGSIKITPPRALAVAALFGALAGWLIVAAANSFDLVAPQVPWTAPVGLFLIAALVAVIAYSTYQRIHVRRQRIDPQRAVAFLVLGKASALAGALVAGGYLTYALMFITRLDAAAPRDRVIKSAVAAVAGVALAVAGLLLERACRVPKSDDEEEVEDAEA
jgi:lysylphosphatidylglycerol synthetase-like protein (DUF2156 family)